MPDDAAAVRGCPQAADGPWARGHDLPQLPRHAAVRRVRRDARRTATQPGDRHRPRSGDPACDLTYRRGCPTTDRRPGHHPGVDGSVAQRRRARTLHPHLGTTLWTVTSGAVDERGRIRGQLVDRRWTTSGSRAVHAAPPRPRARPELHPQDATPCDLPGRPPSTPSTAPLLLLDVSLSEERRRTRRWMNRSGGPGTPRPGPGPGMAPGAPRLYGDRTGSARAQSRHGRPLDPQPDEHDPRPSTSPSGRSTPP